MSKYNEYARKLDETFRKAQEEYEGIVAVLDNARERAKKHSSKPRDAVSRAEYEAAQKSLVQAEETFKRKAYAICERYEAEVNRLTADLTKAVKAGGSVNPSEVDANALELLKSGIMTAADCESMMEQFKDNRTMKRLIAEYAQTAQPNGLDRAEAHKEATALRSIALNHVQEDDALLTTWKELSDASKIYLGSRSPAHVNYVKNMQAHWDDGGIRDGIANF